MGTRSASHSASAVGDAAWECGQCRTPPAQLGRQRGNAIRVALTALRSMMSLPVLKACSSSLMMRTLTPRL